MLTAEERHRYAEILRNPGNRTRSELCRDLGLSYLELSRVLADLGLALPPARRDPRRMEVPREKLEELVRAGMNRSQMQIALGLSNRGLMRLLRQYGLEVLSPAQRNRQLEAQGLRQCIECRQIKALATDFYNDRTNPLGKNRRCKECLNRWSVWHRQQARLPAEQRPRTNPRTPWADQGLRRCRRCHQVKPLATDFPESPNERGGRSVCCHACHQVRRREAEEKQRAAQLAAQGLRMCSRCGQVKSLTADFGVNRRDPLGRQTRCRACQREIAQAKRRAAAAAAPAPARSAGPARLSPALWPAAPRAPLAAAVGNPTSPGPAARPAPVPPLKPGPPPLLRPASSVPLPPPQPPAPTGEPPQAAA